MCSARLIMSSLSRVCSRSASQMPRSACTLSAPMKARSKRQPLDGRLGERADEGLAERPQPAAEGDDVDADAVGERAHGADAGGDDGQLGQLGRFVIASASAPIVDPASSSTVSPGSIWAAAQRAMSRLAAWASPRRWRSEASGWWARLMTPP